MSSTGVPSRAASLARSLRLRDDTVVGRQLTVEVPGLTIVLVLVGEGDGQAVQRTLGKRGDLVSVVNPHRPSVDERELEAEKKPLTGDDEDEVHVAVQTIQPMHDARKRGEEPPSRRSSQCVGTTVCVAASVAMRWAR